MEDHLPAAIALGRGRLAATQKLFTFDRVFSFCFKGRCTVRDKPWEIQEKILFHHAFRLFNAHVHPLKDGINMVCTHTCTHTHYMCSLLVRNDQIDLHTKTKRSGSGNPTPIPWNRTDLAIRPLPPRKRNNLVDGTNNHSPVTDPSLAVHVCACMRVCVFLSHSSVIDT